MEKVFNVNKTLQEYREKQPLFFGPNPGVFDTINKHYPSIWSLYKVMKAQDWSEDEFDYSQCNLDFKNCPKPMSDMMITTLAWQWEADSVASRNIAPVLAPFISDSRLWAAWQRLSDNEVVHAATYSEIVRMSFDDPEKVLADILAVKESISRLLEVKRVFDDMYNAAHEYALKGKLSEDEIQPYYDKLFLGVVALYLLERVQFMASFAITFTICGTNYFQSIGKAVQKIAQDELEVHVALDKEVIKIELQTARGQETYNRLKPQIVKIFKEIVDAELTWTDYLFSQGRELVGTNAAIVKNWVLFNAQDVNSFLELNTDYKFPKVNPMPHLEDWINISKSQAAPQEQDGNQYKVGLLVRDDDSSSFDVDF